MKIIFIIILILISMEDIKARRIPDDYHYLIAGLGVLHLITAQEGPWEYILGAFVISVPMLCITILRSGAFGGGDIKLMAVSGLCLGAEKIWFAAVIALFLAGFYCTFLILKYKKRAQQFPLGPFLCIGIIFSLFFAN